MLARLEDLRDAPEEGTRDAALDEEELLAGYAGEEEVGSGDAPAKLRINIQRKFDAHLARRVAAAKGERFDWCLNLIELQALLDERSVLLSQYVGAAADGRFALATLLVTREDVALAQGAGNMPTTRFLELKDDANTVKTNWMGVLVASVRRAVLDEPGPANLTPEAAQLLTSNHDIFLGGGIKERLADLRRAGKDRLLIHPHGALHFYPFHLLGPEDQPLASEWFVGSLPHPALLARAASAVAAPAHAGARALGLSFAEGRPHNLPPLPGASEEALTVAKLMGGRAWTDGEATEARLLEALTTARIVHIATHGRHRVSAPAFQALFLNPDGIDDGVFHAYEAIGLDLRALELVTLSACETALGRVDFADNPRGLPACLMLAGVNTIVGTLWPVESDVAASFFATLYGAVRDGSDRRDAFVVAQAAARASFPAYRDWGAFHYVGV